LWRKGYKCSKFICGLEKVLQGPSVNVINSQGLLLWVFLHYVSFSFFTKINLENFFFMYFFFDEQLPFLIILLPWWMKSFWHALSLMNFFLGSLDWVATYWWSLRRVILKEIFIFSLRRVQRICESIMDEETWSYILSNHDCLIFK